MSSSTALPIADTPAVRRYAGAIARRNPRLLWTALSLHVLAAVAALAAPRLLGELVEAVETGTTTSYVDKVILVLAGFLVLQTVLTRYARLASQVLGEKVLAELREDFVGNALALPVGVVESAGSGDLLTRTSRDVDQLGWSVRWALRSGRSRSSPRSSRSRRRSASAGGSRSPACSASLRWSWACGGTSPAPRTATCARTRPTR